MPEADTTFDIRTDINSAFRPMFNSASRELIIYGGAGAGKSYAVAQKMIAKALKHKDGPEPRRILVVRKYGPSLKLTCWKLVNDLLQRYGVPYKDNKTGLTIKIGMSELIFMPVVNTTEEAADRLKSLTDITDIWIEEATELSFDEYHQIRLRLRGEELEQGYRQVVLTFNPIDQNHWVHSHFFEGNRGEKQKYTYKDNEFIDNDYAFELEDLKNIDEVLYQVYTLGNWGVFGAIIFTRYEIEEFDYPLDWYDEILAGCDFGYEHPFAWLLIGLKENHAYIIDEIYKRKLITSEIIELIEEKQKEHRGLPATFCDSAEPDRITEMANAGLQVYPAQKNVADGINAVKGYHLHIHPRCLNALKEIRGYQRKKDRQGNVLEEPVKANNHAMDALRYGLYSYKRLVGEQEPVMEYYDPVVISPL